MNRFFALLLAIGLPTHAAAYERPWGNVQEPAPRAPVGDSGYGNTRSDGYQGRYNPWGGQPGGGVKQEAQREPRAQHYPKRQSYGPGSAPPGRYDRGYYGSHPYSPYGGGYGGYPANPGDNGNFTPFDMMPWGDSPFDMMPWGR